MFSTDVLTNHLTVCLNFLYLISLANLGACLKLVLFSERSYFRDLSAFPGPGKYNGIIPDRNYDKNYKNRTGFL